MRILLFGASGFVGSAIAAEARARGHEVTSASAPRLIASADQIALSHEDPAWADAGLCLPENTWREALGDVDAVVNAAGLASPEGSGLPELFGANALWPSTLRTAVEAQASLTGRRLPLVHLSSAAVLGSGTLHARPQTAPFSPYSASKAAGETALLAETGIREDLPVCLVRATSVQGEGRPMTRSLARLALSPLASYAVEAPTPVVSVQRLARLVVGLAERMASEEPTPRIVLQPWEGLTTSSLLLAAGAQHPRKVPAPAARAVVRGLAFAGTRVPKAAAMGRRLELLWFGQAQEEAWPPASELAGGHDVQKIFR